MRALILGLMSALREVVGMPECVVCEEVITQPLCAACLQRQVATWLWEKYPERDGLLQQLEELTDEVLTAGGTLRCIKCAMPMALCNHCYTEHVFSWIKGNLPELITEFHTIFRYGNDRFWYEDAPEQPRPRSAVVVTG